MTITLFSTILKVTAIKIWCLNQEERINKESIERRKITYIANPIRNLREKDGQNVHVFFD